MSLGVFSMAYDLGFNAAAEIYKQQLSHMEQMWLLAEEAADHWYFEANNPEEARAARAARASTTAIDVQIAREATAQRWAALDAASTRQEIPA